MGTVSLSGINWRAAKQNTNMFSHPGVLPWGIIYLGTDAFPDVVIETTIILTTSRWVSISTGCTEQNFFIFLLLPLGMYLLPGIGYPI